jgi:uncharacterized protein (TIGR02996 family)
MIAFPVLEVVAATEGAGGLRVGALLPLRDRFVLGRGPECDLLLPEGVAGHQHCVVERRYQRWWLLDNGFSAGTFHNGLRVTNVELQHLDLLEVPSGPTLRFLEREPPRLREPALEAALAAAPDDPQRWAVYADWLLERGDPLGERLSAPRPEHDGRWLGALAVPWGCGDVEVTWWAGLPSRVVLRRLSRALAPLRLQGLVEALAADDHFRFLRHLEVDPESFGLSWDHELAEGLRPFQQGAWPLLESVRLGPLSEGLSMPATDRQLAALEAGHPRVRLLPPLRPPDPARLEVLSSPAQVTTVPPPGGQVLLSARADTLAGRLPECALMVKAPEGHPAGLVAVRFAREATRWCVEDLFARARPFRRLEFALRVNGREVVDAWLRSGDVLELAAGLLVRFGAESR